MTREEAIRCLSVHSSTNGSGLCTDKQHYDAKQVAIKALEQESKTGHWKQISPARIYECDICGQNVMTDDISAYRYCHGCGAKMESEGEK